MPDQPMLARDYKPEYVALVRSTYLYLATKLGDLMDEIVVVGGLVPQLLIDHDHLPAGADAHVGTTDLDVGLSIAILNEGRYQAVRGRLREAGLRPDVNENGNITRQRWKLQDYEVTVDFLIPPTLPEDRGGALRNLDRDLAAVITPGLHLAFRDRRTVPLSGQTVRGEVATRNVSICGPAAYVVLKALAFQNRGENKDAYDLFYVIRNFERGPESVAELLKPMLVDPDAAKAVGILSAEFQRGNAVGPQRVADFMGDSTNDAIKADVVAFVRALLGACEVF
jgi:hypothetical protein